MAKKPKDFEDTHKQGKWCGYELLPNGDIVIAPTYERQFSEVFEAREAIATMLRIVTKQCCALQKVETKNQRELWDKVMDDYDLDPMHYIYTCTYGVITRKKRPDPAEEE